LLLTGNPGVGKTTVLLKVAGALKAGGYSVGGMISREVRSCGERVGFEILDLNSNRCGWLAHVNQPDGPRVGKYHVNLHDLEDIGVNSILKAAKECDVVCIDEIGPMELFSERFKEAVKQAADCGKLLVGIVHWRVRDKLIEEVRSREDAEIVEVTLENRNRLQETVVAKAVAFLKSQRK
jgi:nucleoside-triphosphatase